MKQEISELWQYDSDIIQRALQADYDNFKSNAANFKISLFNPQKNGYKYLKTLIYQICRTLSDENFQRLTRIKNRHICNPISVKYRGEHICMDYLQAVYEIEFMQQHIQFENKCILEIGAGYGRTCHAILSNYNVRGYDIVDLDVCLALSQKYLKDVLSKEHFAKIRFIPAPGFPPKDIKHADLAINIDSMHEMMAETVYDYLNFINEYSNYFFIKSAVGKYQLSGTNADTPDPEGLKHILQTGIMRDLIDIWDQDSVRSQNEKFIQAYKPGKQWTCIADSETIPWSYHWQALYRND